MDHQNISKSLRCLWFPLLLFFFSNPSSAASYNIPRLSPFRKTGLEKIIRLPKSSSISADFETQYYEQPLDHFNYAPGSYETFKQKYVINRTCWGGPDSDKPRPIFAYLGAESALSKEDILGLGFLEDMAKSFEALLVYIEHRFYGESVPYGSLEKAMKNETTRGYLNSAQALADYAEVLMHVKKNVSSPKSPVIVFGASYGGNLAAWFRLKYPHVALGALASSAPILYFDNITAQSEFYSIVSEDFKSVSTSCYETIRDSWPEIEKVASVDGGLTSLEGKLKLCWKLKNSSELKDFLEYSYVAAALYGICPDDYVTRICRAIDDAKGSYILDRIHDGIAAQSEDPKSCINTHLYDSSNDPSMIAWKWQECSEIVMPIGRDGDETMFQQSPFNMTNYIEECKSFFGNFKPRPHWVTTYYGGHDMKLILRRFASNIIFSNGLRDPYSGGGVKTNISDSVVAVSTDQGTHCLDLQRSTSSDPQWLVDQRSFEVQTIAKWIEEYNEDLRRKSSKVRDA